MLQLDSINVSVKDAASLLGVSHFMVRAWCRSGKMTHRKIGTRLLIPREEVERILRESLRPRNQSATSASAAAAAVAI